MKAIFRFVNAFKKKEDTFDKAVFFKFASGDQSMEEPATNEHYKLLDAGNKAYISSLACKFMKEITATVKDPLYLSDVRKLFLTEYLSTVKQ